MSMAKRKTVNGKLKIATCEGVVVGNGCWLLEICQVKVSCWGNRREGDHWGDLGVDGWIILGRISRRWDVGT